jgi:maltose alpha-D-glucosyltransferase/alpha-amylase
MNSLPEPLRADAEEVLAMRSQILAAFKRIYSRKIDTMKVRIHGDYHLGQVLFTGKDLVILDFEGEPARPYSERRLKRTPIRDVAGMIRSYHYAPYASLFLDAKLSETDRNKLMPFADLWFHYMSGFFMEAYLQAVKDSPLVPKNEEDLRVLLQTFLLEKAIYELNYELNNRPDWVLIPLRGIRQVMDLAVKQSGEAVQ